jgi:small subunit ribosomal protein S3Ae
MPKRAAKVKDKWREKAWLTLYAPSSFGGVQIGSIPATDAMKAVGRVVQTTLYDFLKQDPSHYSIKVSFQVSKVEGNSAFTIFRGHEYAREYMRSLVRRGSSMVGLIRDYTTKDGYVLRIYVIAFTQGRINSSKKRRIREAADRLLQAKASSMDYEQFVQEIVLNKVASDIFAEARKTANLRHLGIRKTKLISAPEGVQVSKQRVAEATPASQ